MSSHAVVIGPEFFAKAKNDYADWTWALVREFAQNCIDAPGCDEITVTLSHDATNNTTVLIVRNNGAPMSKDVLTGKLLALGGTGKGFAGTVGGFGKAKELLYLSHKSYRIRTGTLMAAGSGANYDLQEGGTPLYGTESEIVMEGDLASTLSVQFSLFATYAQWDGDLWLCGVNQNGVDDRLHLRKGSRRRDFSWGAVYTNNSAQGLLLCRIGGIPMFTKPICYKGMVLVELSGTSGDVLTSNRDGLRYQQQAELDQFITNIAVNRSAAFKDKARKVEKVKFAGYKLAGCCEEEEAELGQAMKMVTPVYVKSALVDAVVTATSKQTAPDAPALSAEQVRAVFRPEFYLKSEIGGRVPEWFVPGSFSDNSKRLVTNWIGLLVELASLTKLSTPFSVGFIFDPDCVGQHEREAGEHVVYVSPAEIVQKDGKPRQLKVRWRFDAAGNWKLLALAIHEFVHLEGHNSHDEDYAGRLTDLFALVLTQRTRFSRHFSAPVAWPD